MSDGWVYFAANELGHVKVGFSRQPSERVAVLKHSTRHPGFDEASLLAQIPGSFALERSIHRQLEPFRVNGSNEWFYANHGLCDLIRSIPQHAEPPAVIASLEIEIQLDPSWQPFQSISSVSGLPYLSDWDLATIPEELLKSELARRNGLKRKTFGAGSGRPRSDGPRCECGRFTAEYAKKFNHKCMR